MAKVIFDGDNKIINVISGTLTLDVKVDLYSDWKEWVANPTSSNAKYLQAFRSVGGEPTVGGAFLGSTYFLLNDWKIRPWTGNYFLSVNGNLFTEDASSPFVSASGPSNILLTLERSNLVDVVSTSGSGDSSFTAADRTMLQNIDSSILNILSSSIAKHGHPVNGSTEKYIYTDIVAPERSFDNHFIIVHNMNDDYCVTRKVVRFHNTNGKIMFDISLPFTASVDDHYFLVPGYNRTIRVGF